MSTAERTIKLDLASPKQGATMRTLSRAGYGMAVVLRMLLNRFQANRLTELDDRQLADIGLSRGDVLNALDVGLLEDPTMHLSRAAQIRAKSRFTRLQLD
jgi:uncharacterized protein YjiS (DUF1127 family)